MSWKPEIYKEDLTKEKAEFVLEEAQKLLEYKLKANDIAKIGLTQNNCKND